MADCNCGYGNAGVYIHAPDCPSMTAAKHQSDCATHNEPAYPNGPCDCLPGWTERGKEWLDAGCPPIQPTDKPGEGLTVSQAARDAYASTYDANAPKYAASIRSGDQDWTPLMQSAARFEQSIRAEYAERSEPVAGLPDDLAQIVEGEIAAWKGLNGGVFAIKACANAVSIAIRAAMIKRAPTPGAMVPAHLLDRAEQAWQRFFYPANECFTNELGDKHLSVDLEVADCLRMVLAAIGREVVTPDGSVPLPATVPAQQLAEARAENERLRKCLQVLDANLPNRPRECRALARAALNPGKESGS